ncbi:MAG: helix-turn-helix transcriptional regulator, partial [Planctomycetota bacterium]
ASSPAVFTGAGCLSPEDYVWLLVPTDPGILGGMTHAELETLRLIALGMSTEQIAERLSRTKKAIERRRMSMRRKLGVEDRQALSRAANQTGLGHLPESRLSQFVRCSRARQRHLAGESWVSPEPAGV